MKKSLIALAALATLAAGTAATTTAAQAKVHVNFNVDVPGLFVGPGYYEPAYYDDGPDCGYVTVKKVYWIDGHKVIKWKKKLVCE